MGGHRGREEHRVRQLLSGWERLIQTGDFGKRARDVEVVLKLIHAVRPEPEERLFGLA